MTTRDLTKIVMDIAKMQIYMDFAALMYTQTTDQLANKEIRMVTLQDQHTIISKWAYFIDVRDLLYDKKHEKNEFLAC